MPNTVTTDPKNNASAIQFEASSNVRSAVLHPDGRLEVTFKTTGKNASRYSYANFTEAKLDEWSKAPSAGRWFDANIKKRPDLHPVVPTPPPAPGDLDASRPQVPSDDPKAEVGSFARDPNAEAAVASAGELLAATHAKGGEMVVDLPPDEPPHELHAEVKFTLNPGERVYVGEVINAATQPESVLVDARRFYERYIRNSGGLAWDGKPCPKWEQLGLPVQSHWCSVVLEARQTEQRPVGSGALDSPIDAVYDERDRCVIAFARSAKKLGWKVGLADHDAADADWDPAWRTILYVDTPAGQMSWHLHERDLPLTTGLPRYDGKWDGHSTAEKYERMARL